LTSGYRNSNLTSTSYHLGGNSELSLCSPSRDRSSRPRRPSSATSAILSGDDENADDDGDYDDFDDECDIDDDNSDASSIRYAMMKRKLLRQDELRRAQGLSTQTATSNAGATHAPVRFADVAATTGYDTSAPRPTEHLDHSEYGPAPDVDDPEQMAIYEAWLWQKHHESQQRMQQRQHHHEEQDGPNQESKHLQHVDSGFDETMVEALERGDDDGCARVLSGSSQSTEKCGSDGMAAKSVLSARSVLEVKGGTEVNVGRSRVR
jgi:hypothetical protein